MGSAFAGIGGFDLAAQRAGIDTAWQIEIDRSCQHVLEQHFPDAKRYDDITKLSGHELEPVDLICAGFPCQDLSVAGRRAGIRGTRSGLFFDLCRIIRVVRPRYVVLENVPGLLSRSEWMGAVLGELAELGFDVAWRVLDAQFFGVPQRRRRVFVVGHFGSRGAPVEILFEPESSARDSAAGEPTWPRVAATIAASAHNAGVHDVNFAVSTLQGGGVRDIGSTPKRQRVGISSRQVVAALTSNGVGTCGPDDNQAQAGHLIPTEPGGARTFQKVVRSGARDMHGDLPPDVWDERDVAATLSPFDLGSDTRAVELVVAATVRTREGRGCERGDGQDNLIVHALTSEGADASEDGTGRGTPVIAFHFGSHPDDLTELAPPVTNRNGDPGGVMEQTAVRRLTPLECTRLQGFPDDWLELSDADASQAHAREVLHGLWREDASEDREGRWARVAAALLSPEVLLAGVYGGWVSWPVAFRRATRARSLQGADAWPEGFVRELWRCASDRPAPHRRESFEQLARQLGRPLSQLPLDGASARAALLCTRVWPQASAEWPVRYARPTAEARSASPDLSDAARYRQLGNAVAVPVAEWVLRRLLVSAAVGVEGDV